MNEKNYDYLLKSLLDAGFPYRVRHPLRDQLKLQLTAFVLPCSIPVGRLTLETTIFFRKWQDCPLYYLQKYHAVLYTRSDNREMGQDFYFSRMFPVIRPQEMVRLLAGKPVFRPWCRFKDRVVTKSWLRLDLTRTDSCGNFIWQFDPQPKLLSS